MHYISCHFFTVNMAPSLCHIKLGNAASMQMSFDAFKYQLEPVKQLKLPLGPKRKYLKRRGNNKYC